MVEERAKFFRHLARVSGMGLVLVGATFLGLYVGTRLDRWLKTEPIFTLVCMIVGVIIGFFHIFEVGLSLEERRKLKKGD